MIAAASSPQITAIEDEYLFRKEFNKEFAECQKNHPVATDLDGLQVAENTDPQSVRTGRLYRFADPSNRFPGFEESYSLQFLNHFYQSVENIRQEALKCMQTPETPNEYRNWGIQDQFVHKGFRNAVYPALHNLFDRYGFKCALYTPFAHGLQFSGVTLTYIGHKEFSLSNVFRDAYEKKVLTDVTIVSANGRSQAHSLVLSLVSDVCSGMLQNNMRERREGIIDLKRFSKQTVDVMLDYIYKQKLPFTEDESPNPVELLVLADEWHITSLFGKALNAILKHVESDQWPLLGELGKRYENKLLLTKYNEFRLLAKAEHLPGLEEVYTRVCGK